MLLLIWQPSLSGAAAVSAHLTSLFNCCCFRFAFALLVCLPTFALSFSFSPFNNFTADSQLCVFNCYCMSKKKHGRECGGREACELQLELKCALSFLLLLVRLALLLLLLTTTMLFVCLHSSCYCYCCCCWESVCYGESLCYCCCCLLAFALLMLLLPACLRSLRCSLPLSLSFFHFGCICCKVPIRQNFATVF